MLIPYGIRVEIHMHAVVKVLRGFLDENRKTYATRHHILNARLTRIEKNHSFSRGNDYHHIAHSVILLVKSLINEFFNTIVKDKLLHGFQTI